MKRSLIALLMALMAVLLMVSCEPDPYTVTFDVDGNTSTVEAQLVAKDGYATKPAKDPTTQVEYMTFACWSLDGKTEFKFAETAITGNITLKALWRYYEVGDKGPAGGVIVYENPNFVASSIEEGKNWKYIEAAPTDATVGDVATFQMGYYNINRGTGDRFDTDDGIGKGLSNTNKILQSLDDRVIDSYYSSGKIDPNYCAAKVATNYKVGDITGWYLPSLTELKQMWEKKIELGMTADTYISSTEINSYEQVVSTDASKTGINPATKAAVRAIRYF